MEAIKPGSASCVRVSHYETVSLKVDDGAYSYVSTARSPVMKISASIDHDNLYDEPRSYSHQPMQFLSESYSRVIPAVKSVESSSDAITQLHNGNKVSNTSFSSCDTNVESSSTDHVLPYKSGSLKDRASSCLDSETEEELEKNDQYQFQLRILEQMQTLVQKLEDVSDVVGSPKLSKTLFSSQTKPHDTSADSASVQHYTSEEVCTLSKSSQLLKSDDETEGQSTAVISHISSSTGIDPSASTSSAAKQQEPCSAPKKQGTDSASQKRMHGLELSSVPRTSMHHFTSESEKSHTSLSKNIYVNVDHGSFNELSNTLLSTCENETEDRSENQIFTDNTDEGPQQHSRTVGGKYKSPVSHNKQQFLKPLQREKQVGVSQLDMISE